MFVQEKYKKLKSSDISNVISKLDIKSAPKGKIKSLEDLKGTGSYILSDKIGFCEGCEYSLFFVDDFMVIKVQEGKLYIEENEVIFSLDNHGKKAKYKSNIDKIVWKSKSEMYNYCLYFLESKYNLTILTDKKDYISHLVFVLNSFYNVNDSKLFSIKPIKYDESKGGKFKFVIKEKIEKPSLDNVNTILYSSKNSEKDSYDDSNKIRGFIGKSKKNIYDIENENLDKDDDIIDYEEEEPLNLHEIDIFKDYSSSEVY